MLYKLSLLTVLVLALAACPRMEPVNDSDRPAERPAEPASLTFRVVAEGTHSPVSPEERVYRDAAEWRAVREGLRRTQYEPSLSMESVLLAAVDAPTGGFRVRFDSVLASPDRDVVAIYTVEQPGPDCMVTQALTQPFQVIAVPDLPEGTVRFEQRRETYGC